MSVKKIVWRIKNAIFRTLNPWFWLQNDPTDWEHDWWLISTLRSGAEITSIGKHTCRVDGKEVWICNYPYAFGSLCSSPIDFLPSPLTRVALRRAVIHHALKNGIGSAA